MFCTAGLTPSSNRSVRFSLESQLSRLKKFGDLFPMVKFAPEEGKSLPTVVILDLKYPDPRESVPRVCLALGDDVAVIDQIQLALAITIAFYNGQQLQLSEESIADQLCDIYRDMQWIHKDEQSPITMESRLKNEQLRRFLPITKKRLESVIADAVEIHKIVDGDQQPEYHYLPFSVFNAAVILYTVPNIPLTQPTFQ